MGKLRIFASTVGVVAAVVATTVVAIADPPVRVISVGGPIRNSAPGPKDLLAEKLGSRQATSGIETPDGNAAKIAKGLALVDSAERAYGDVSLGVYEMADEAVAAALLDILEPVGATAVDVGDDGWSSGTTSVARSGVYVVVAEGSAEAAAADAAAVLARIGSQPLRLSFARVLPSDDRVTGTEHYVASFAALRRLRPDLTQDVYRLEAGGADAVLADYRQGGSGGPFRLLVVEYQTPQLAADAERSMQAYAASLAEDVKRSRVFRREGNYLVEASGVVDASVATSVSSAVKYDVTIKMLDGPDPVSVRSLTDEAQKAALVFINSFAIVGLSFVGAVGCGLVIGMVVFTRRRRASAERFSDAGGMVHLELQPGTRRLERSEPIGLLRGGPGD